MRWKHKQSSLKFSGTCLITCLIVQVCMSIEQRINWACSASNDVQQLVIAGHLTSVLTKLHLTGQIADYL